MNKLLIAFLFFNLTACASFKNLFTTQHSSDSSAATGEGVPPAPKNYSHTQEETVAAPEKQSRDSYADTTEPFLKAVDNFVFKGEEGELKKYCADSRFECWVNDKRYPKGQKKRKHKGAAYLSGSKSGIHNEEKYIVKYAFYPEH